MIPNSTKNTPPGSQYIRLVSGVPRITLPRYWGVMPSWGWGEAMKRWRRIRPTEKGLLRMLLRAPLTVPFSPLMGVAKLARRVGDIAHEEMDEEAHLKTSLLALQMSREMGEITEEDFKKRANEINRKVEEIKKLSGDKYLLTGGT